MCKSPKRMYPDILNYDQVVSNMGSFSTQWDAVVFLVLMKKITNWSMMDGIPWV